MFRARHGRCLLLLSTLVVGGCTGPPPESGAKSYPLEGTVVEVDLANRKITIDHREIPGFMPAMIMPFVVREEDAALLDIVSPGDEVTARLVVPDTRYWLEELVVVKQGTPDPNATARPLLHGLHPGEALPEVVLVNQAGEAVHLSDYRGRALALTFIFTRCPLPDFCPRMMNRFAEVHDSLVADEELLSRTHLLTVSFDTEHDTPEVLLAYGKPFQKTASPFSHWELASGTGEAVRTLAGALALDYYEEEGSFAHNLRTAVIDPEGNLHSLYRGNEWTAEELLTDLRAAAGEEGQGEA
jgi:protein SCO1/2